MKKYINRNIFWSNLFIEQLVQLGVKHACVSPGSRNTSLTFALASNRKIKKYIHIDERSGGFFALGIAKQTKQPVAVFTTSGTAVAELYPAIIEAFQQRIPLIICTADRPGYLKNVGANQTINQDNIFSNHIRYFSNLGLPNISVTKLNEFTGEIWKGVCLAKFSNKGPIHFNLPFEKPFEPTSFTENINFEIKRFIKTGSCQKDIVVLQGSTINTIFTKIDNCKNGIISVGWNNYESKFYREVIKFAKKINFPIFADGSSNLRFMGNESNNIISNHSAFIEEFKEKIDLIIQFGNAPTSQQMLSFMNNTNAAKFLINEHGDIKDPSRKKGRVVNISDTDFIKLCNKNINQNNHRKNWLNEIRSVDRLCGKIKDKVINKSAFGSEPRLISEIITAIPKESNLIISNSSPIREFDYFASANSKKIKVFTNRGASGIDGIISTASGIASQSKQNTYLVIGDLAFYHNISALSSLNEFNISLNIILINNNGGGIFNMLPVSKNNKYFEKYWRTPQYLDFSKIVKSFGLYYFSPKSWKSFNVIMNRLNKDNIGSVTEVKTNSIKSFEIRKMYWDKIKEEINRAE